MSLPHLHRQIWIYVYYVPIAHYVLRAALLQSYSFITSPNENFASEVHAIFTVNGSKQI